EQRVFLSPHFQQALRVRDVRPRSFWTRRDRQPQVDLRQRQVLFIDERLPGFDHGREDAATRALQNPPLILFLLTSGTLTEIRDQPESLVAQLLPVAGRVTESGREAVDLAFERSLQRQLLALAPIGRAVCRVHFERCRVFSKRAYVRESVERRGDLPVGLSGVVRVARLLDRLRQCREALQLWADESFIACQWLVLHRLQAHPRQRFLPDRCRRPFMPSVKSTWIRGKPQPGQLLLQLDHLAVIEVEHSRRHEHRKDRFAGWWIVKGKPGPIEKHAVGALADLRQTRREPRSSG